MANAYSHLHNFSNPIVDQGVDRAGQMLLHRQQKYDHNKQKLQSLQDEFSSLDMAKDVDKEYAESRLLKIKEMTDRYLQGVDLSDDSFTSAISSNMHQFIDDNIINAVASTRRMRSEDKEVEEMRKKNPDKYNEANQKWAMARSGRNEYLQSQEVGEVYRGGYGFVEYRDLQSKLSKHAPKIAEAVGAEYVVLGNGNGYFRSLDTYKTVDRRKLEAALDGLLDEKDKTQMAVNTWATYGQMSEDQLKNSYDATYRARLANVDQEIERFQNYADNINDEAKKKAALESIKSLEEDREAISKNLNYDAVNNNIGRSGIESVLYNQSLKAPYLEAYARAPELINSEVYKLDVETRKAERDLMRIQIAQQKVETARLRALRESETGEESEQQRASTAGMSKIEPDGDLPTLLESLQEEEVKTYEGLVANVLTDFTEGEENFDPEKAKEKMNKFLSKVQYEDLQGSTVKYKIDGKDYEVIVKDNIGGELVPNENYQAIANYLAQKETKSVIKEKVDNTFSTTISNLQETLTAGIKAEMSGLKTFFTLTQEESLPNVNHEYVYNESTGLYDKIVSDEYKYTKLLFKQSKGEKLTDGEEITLKASIAEHMLLDPEIGESEKVELRRYLEDEILKDVADKSSIIKPFSYRGPKTGTGFLKRDFYLSQYTSSDFMTDSKGRTRAGVVASDVGSYISNAFNAVMQMAEDEKTLPLDRFVPRPSTDDLSGVKDPASLISNMSKTLSESTKAEDYQTVIRGNTLTLSEDDTPEDYEKIAGYIQNTNKHVVKNKSRIILKPEVSGNDLTGSYILSYTHGSGGTANVVDDLKLTEEEVEKFGFTSFRKAEKPFISAAVKNAYYRDLGKVSTDEKYYKGIKNIAETRYEEDKRTAFENFAETVTSNYTVHFEKYNNTGEFVYTLKNENGSVVYRHLTGKIDYSLPDFVQMRVDTEKYKKMVITNYLLNPIDEKGREIKF